MPRAPGSGRLDELRGPPAAGTKAPLRRAWGGAGGLRPVRSQTSRGQDGLPGGGCPLIGWESLPSYSHGDKDSDGAGTLRAGRRTPAIMGCPQGDGGTAWGWAGLWSRGTPGFL